MDEFTLSAARQFAGDTYATDTTGIVLEEAREGYARCRLDIEPKHHNARRRVMGGAIFTLADYAFAVAVGCGEQPPTVTLSSTAHFIASPHGSRIYAEAKCIKSGRSTCFVEVTVTGDDGTLVATVSEVGYRLSR